ncbi:hypothetical protein J5N97_026609 [Dioscorea zingiberensis]|uniref:SPRY domain-containing protein n=1 Tax=Dioscorea zingiberensis TaxID=325984 RepID=A0A9D5C2L7_9LILI|nr:hypothetical protein J5N97_026609 [Dioscorea zingiberensis]
MKHWTKILIAGVIPGALILLLSLILFLCWRRRGRVSTSTARPFTTDPSAASRSEKLEAGLTKFHLSPIKFDSKNSLRFHQLHHHHHHPNPDQLPSFHWDDHPRLITEAVENGWLRFAFHGRSSLPSLRSPQLRWGFCAVCDGGKQRDSADINWEIPQGSSEFMQTVTLNPGVHQTSGDDELPCSIARMSLPLPGPSLPTSSFPQEAYFEISILYLESPPPPRLHRNSKRSKVGGAPASSEGDRVKLIQENSSEAPTESGNGGGGVVEFASPIRSIEESKPNTGNAVVSLGLSIGGSSQASRMRPGTYSGSIGFHSDGSVCLDGKKLVFESEGGEWTGVNRVIGCGFNPSKKLVFLTVDSELVHVIHCNSDVYKHPLYPVIAANAQVMALVNLGQCAFKYAPANARRTTNPCFIRSSPDVTASIAGYEDSRELFSVGRLETDWYDIMMKSKNRSSSKTSIANGDESTADAESDLFEIALHS